MSQQLVLVNVEDLKAAQGWILLDHAVSDVHSFVVSVTNASFDVWQVQRGFPIHEPVFLRVSVLSGKWLGNCNF